MKDLKLKENEVVHCKTEKQANKVLKIAYKLGCEWQVQSLGNRFYDCKENTVYHLDNIITYSDLDYCKRYEKQVITAKEFLKRHKEPKKGKLTIIVSKNYKELYEDNLALLNHLLLDSVKGDKDWIKGVQENNLNITLYTDKNDPELFKKSFGKFEVKLMDTEELTLENIQVDCSDLTTEQIEEMKRVVVDNGYKLWDEECAFKVNDYGDHFCLAVNVFCILTKMDDLTTITYDKFMELFDDKKEECNNNLKGLVLISHKGVDKSRLQDSEYVEQMIREGKILHVENFNKSLVMDNGSTISNVKEGEVKSIEELHVEHREQSFNGKCEEYAKPKGYTFNRISEYEFYKGLDAKLNPKLNPKGLCIEWMEEFNKIPGHVFDALKFRTPQEQAMLKVDSNQVNTSHNLKPTFNPQPHYRNEYNSLFKIAEQLGLNHYEFDVFKRLVRCRKKGQFKEDLNKIKDTVDLYLNDI